MRVDADGAWQDLPAGETGVLAISGPTVFPGYVIGRDADGHVLDGLGKLRRRLAGHRRPRHASTRTASSTSPAGPRT